MLQEEPPQSITSIVNVRRSGASTGAVHVNVPRIDCTGSPFKTTPLGSDPWREAGTLCREWLSKGRMRKQGLNADGPCRRVWLGTRRGCAVWTGRWSDGRSIVVGDQLWDVPSFLVEDQMRSFQPSNCTSANPSFRQELGRNIHPFALNIVICCVRLEGSAWQDRQRPILNFPGWLEPIVVSPPSRQVQLAASCSVLGFGFGCQIRSAQGACISTLHHTTSPQPFNRLRYLSFTTSAIAFRLLRRHSLDPPSSSTRIVAYYSSRYGPDPRTP
jgi:hypothetical protein